MGMTKSGDSFQRIPRQPPIASRFENLYVAQGFTPLARHRDHVVFDARHHNRITPAEEGRHHDRRRLSRLRRSHDEQRTSTLESHARPERDTVPVTPSEHGPIVHALSRMDTSVSMKRESFSPGRTRTIDRKA